MDTFTLFGMHNTLELSQSESSFSDHLRSREEDTISLEMLAEQGNSIGASSCLLCAPQSCQLPY
jgi:hypothetical protein